VKVREGKPDSTKQAAVLADNYESARKSGQSERSHKDVPVKVVLSSTCWEQERRAPGRREARRTIGATFSVSSVKSMDTLQSIVPSKPSRV